MYNYTSDNKESGFIDKHKILQYVSEEEIFKLVFGFIPSEYAYVLSPFRKDNKPGCWFEKNLEGRLVFRDFAYGNRPIDCFEAVKIHYKLKGFYESLKFVYNHFIKGRKLENKVQFKYTPQIKKEVEILFESRDFLNKDAKYWIRYGVSKDQLIADKVFPVKKFHLLNTKNGDVKNRVYESCYAFTDFNSQKKKLYFPFRKGSARFISNCKKNDIGNINKIPSLGRQLIITKSYKDCRVLTNMGKYCIWIQNEGMIPDNEVLIPIIKNYSDIIVWYDNDEAGIKASQKLSDKINLVLPNKSRPITLPTSLNNEGISDPSDLYFKKSANSLKYFINNNL